MKGGVVQGFDAASAPPVLSARKKMRTLTSNGGEVYSLVYLISLPMCLPAGGFDQSRGCASSDSRSIGERAEGEFIFGERRTTLIVLRGVR